MPKPLTSTRVMEIILDQETGWEAVMVQYWMRLNRLERQQILAFLASLGGGGGGTGDVTMTVHDGYVELSDGTDTVNVPTQTIVEE